MAAKKSSGSTRKAAAKKSAATKSTAAKKTSASAAKRAAPAKKSAAKKPTAQKAAASKAPAKKSTKKAAPAKTTATKAATKKAAPKKSTATKAAPKKAAAKAPAATKPAKKAPARTSGKPPVGEGETPWTKNQLNNVRAELERERTRLLDEIAAAEGDIDALMREGGEGAGNDQADVGSNSFERDHEISLARNARSQLELVDAALVRLDGSAFGVCESCGRAIGKLRLEAFPRATLCMACKRLQERR